MFSLKRVDIDLLLNVPLSRVSGSLAAYIGSQSYMQAYIWYPFFVLWSCLRRC